VGAAGHAFLPGPPGCAAILETGQPELASAATAWEQAALFHLPLQVFFCTVLSAKTPECIVFVFDLSLVTIQLVHAFLESELNPNIKI
jgi:hypothetical protein